MDTTRPPKINFALEVSDYETINRIAYEKKISITSIMQQKVKEYILENKFLLPQGKTCGHCQNFNKFCFKLKLNIYY